MKFSTSFLAFLLSAASASASFTIRSKSATASLLSKARRLEDNEEEEQQEEEYQFLMSYSVKLIGCAAGEKYQNPEDGEYEYSSVIFRLCPADECDNESELGCKTGYGDYLIGINTFTDAWLEDKRENMNQDDNFNVEEFSECREYEPDNDNDENQNQNNVYFVGPTCGDNGDIKLGFFADYTCTTEPEGVTFEDISNGWSLPYSDGLVTTYCEDCAGYDNGEYELSEMCMQLYEQASGKCEEEMEYTGMYGAVTSGCEYIAEISPASASGGGPAGKIIGWVVFILVVGGAGFYAYSVWWKKKKAAAGTQASDGLMS